MKNIVLTIFLALLPPAAAAQADVWVPLPDQGEKAQDSRVWPQARTVRQYTGRVTAVADGDTLRVTDNNGAKHKIRLAYIDAPELQQAHGQAARQALSAAVLAKTVDVEVFETDRYQREVAKVGINGRDVNLSQIQQGHAWHYVSIAKRRQNKTDYAAYAYAEAGARQQAAGLWRGKNAQAPWHFRRQAREKQNPSAGGT
ncbi:MULTISPECIES: thermonuclease family protein [unclassified Neisseria]|uniref:thermonuclease family protein n=1 Tax=unclassified Neisseria TaxID=2623750 RepID=UPI001072A0F6|nr:MULTISPECIES: thermonuclease family protein [unclassified Neisseria]MBF0804147.1 thermonuclease family protein [Neisseria sp. 19428wB4_WF04]TFU43104.1 thermonuclease family protein [Neisseria sp. WF04]